MYFESIDALHMGIWRTNIWPCLHYDATASTTFKNSLRSLLLCLHYDGVVYGSIVVYSWVSLGYFAVNLTGGQPKMY